MRCQRTTPTDVCSQSWRPCFTHSFGSAWAVGQPGVTEVDLTSFKGGTCGSWGARRSLNNTIHGSLSPKHDFLSSTRSLCRHRRGPDLRSRARPAEVLAVSSRAKCHVPCAMCLVSWILDVTRVAEPEDLTRRLVSSDVPASTGKHLSEISEIAPLVFRLAALSDGPKSIGVWACNPALTRLESRGVGNNRMADAMVDAALMY